MKLIEQQFGLLKTTLEHAQHHLDQVAVVVEEDLQPLLEVNFHRTTSAVTWVAQLHDQHRIIFKISYLIRKDFTPANETLFKYCFETFRLQF